MPTRRAVIASTAAVAATTVLGTATPAGAGHVGQQRDLRAVVEGWHRFLTEAMKHDSVAVGAFVGHRQHVVNGAAIFQIGSITKTFTALALAIAERSGVVSLDDPLAKLLPNPMPTMTLGQLAEHTAGLPRLPPGIANDWDPTDPYRHFTEQRLHQVMAETTLDNTPGTKHVYSNYGVGLLGFALGRDYETMVREQITQPLGLSDITITLTEAQKRRKVSGFDADDNPVKDWYFPPTIAGAIALYGTANDMLRYLRAHLGDAPAALRPALRLVRQPRFPMEPTGRIGLCWHIGALPVSGRDIVWHNGGTGGYRSYAAFCPSRDVGVVVLINKGDFAVEVPELAGKAILDTLV